MTPGHAILSAASYCDESNHCKSLLLELDLSLMFYQWLKILGDADSTPSGQCLYPEHLIQTFDEQCSSLRAKHSQPWTARLEVMFHGLHLLVYSFAMDRRSALDPSASTSVMVLDTIHAKSHSLVVQLISEVSRVDDSKLFWPVVPKFLVVHAACIGVYLASTTIDLAAKATLLEACKTAVSILAGWSMFSKDTFSRIGRHIATAVRRVESNRTLGLQAIDNGTHKATISSRMATNIPHRIIWNAKHGVTPDSPTHDQHSVPTTDDTSTFFASMDGVDGSSFNNAPQSFDLLFNDWNASGLFDSMNEADFTDIWLDWQSLRGPIPNMTQYDM